METFLYSLGGLIITYFIIVFILWINDQFKTNAAIRNRVAGKIWDIPVELQCQNCKEVSTTNFSLETVGYKCPHCNKDNKVMIQFLTISEDPTWKEEL